MRWKAERLLLRLWRLPLPGWLRRALLKSGNTRFLAGVVAVVLNERGQVFLLHHTYRREHPWALPSGWLKGPEDPLAAIEREMAEECGLRVRVVRPLRVDSARDWPQLDIVYLCAPDGGTHRRSREVSDYGWFAEADLPDIPLRQREILGTILSG